jgi:hypothetical protein
MMALPSPASNQKWHSCLDKAVQKRAKMLTMSILFAAGEQKPRSLVLKPTI